MPVALKYTCNWTEVSNLFPPLPIYLGLVTSICAGMRPSVETTTMLFRVVLLNVNDHRIQNLLTERSLLTNKIPYTCIRKYAYVLLKYNH